MRRGAGLCAVVDAEEEIVPAASEGEHVVAVTVGGIERHIHAAAVQHIRDGGKIGVVVAVAAVFVFDGDGDDRTAVGGEIRTEFGDQM